MKKKIDWPLTLCVIGGAVALLGELKGATDKKRGNTISEVFKRQPLWIKLLIFWIFGGVCCHLAEWRISDDVPNVEIKGDVNIETHQEKA